MDGCDVMFREQLGPKVYDFWNSKFNLEISAARTSLFKNSFAFTGASIWNPLPDDLKQLPSAIAFKKKILFYSILFYSILFYSILFYSILFYSILFYSIHPSIHPSIYPSKVPIFRMRIVLEKWNNLSSNWKHAIWSQIASSTRPIKRHWLSVVSILEEVAAFMSVATRQGYFEERRTQNEGQRYRVWNR